jgi:hypothetical protein
VRNTVAALEDPTYGQAKELLRTWVGLPALEELQKAARRAPSPKIQKRAGRLIYAIEDDAQKPRR